jgi:hypothetical protein
MTTSLTNPTKTLPSVTSTDTIIKVTERTYGGVTHPMWDGYGFSVESDLPRVTKAVAELLNNPNHEVLAVESYESENYDTYPHTDMDVAHTTTKSVGLRVTYFDGRKVDSEWFITLTVRGHGLTFTKRYERVHDEVNDVINEILRNQHGYTNAVEQILLSVREKVSNLTLPRLEEIRTVAVNALVEDQTALVRTQMTAPEKIVKGVKVTVARGRKVPVGTTGTVIWKGQGQYGWRVGVKDSTDTVHWTALTNVDVVLDDAVVAATALAEAKTEYNRSLAKLFGPTRA